MEVHSLAVLLAKPPSLDKAGITEAIAAEFAVATHVAGELPVLTVHAEGNEVMLHVRSGEFPLRELGFKLEHHGWIAVEHANWRAHPEVDSYPLIATVLTALWPESAAAIVHPATKRWALVTRETPLRLRRDDVLDALFARPLRSAEAINSHEDAPDLVAARAEARQRWPEFEEAFRVHRARNFLVKAAVTRGAFTEHIWITVTSVTGEGIEGLLANEPFDLEGLKLGSKVAVRAGAIDDWRFTLEGKVHGYFTKAAVEARQRR